jgi:YegS/Rv2252/BmrU family lipid kinase
MKTKILFIINPLSGIGKQKIIEKLIEKKLDKSIFDYEIVYTQKPKQAIEISKKGVHEHFEIVTAVGGDGSVNEVGRSLIGTSSALAIIPCGSGNGTARVLRLPMDYAKAIDVINQKKSKVIDTFFVNEEIAINTAGIGYAAHIAHEFAKLSKRGFSNYVKLAVRDSIKFKTFPSELEINGETKKIDTFIIDIANGEQWGANAVIAPNAQNDDGVLDVCVVKKFPFLNFPLMAARLFTRSIHRSKYVEIIRAKEAVIRLITEKNYAHIDGEPIMVGNEVKIKINPSSLKVIVN